MRRDGDSEADRRKEPGSPDDDARGSAGVRHDRDLPWGWGITAFCLGFLVLAVAGGALVPWTGLPAQSALLLAAGLIPGWALLTWGHGLPPAALGFYFRGSAWRESALGLALGLGVALVGVAGMAAAGVVRWVEDAGTVEDLLVRGVGTLAYLALPAAAEEALFRGYPLQLLARSWGPLSALLATSAAFGLLHGANPGITPVAMVNLVVAGLFLGVVYLRTGSLWWATGAHLGWNWALGFGVDLPVSGLELVDTPMWTGIPSGPSWLSGGTFGPEGSVIVTVVTLTATVLLWRGRLLRPGPVPRRIRLLAPLRTGPAPGREET